MAQWSKNLPANAGDLDLIPGSGRSPEEGNGNPLRYLAWKIPWIASMEGYSPCSDKEWHTTE